MRVSGAVAQGYRRKAWAFPLQHFLMCPLALTAINGNSQSAAPLRATPPQRHDTAPRPCSTCSTSSLQYIYNIRLHLPLSPRPCTAALPACSLCAPGATSAQYLSTSSLHASARMMSLRKSDTCTQGDKSNLGTQKHFDSFPLHVPPCTQHPFHRRCVNEPPNGQ